jgi:hypothetical protein
MLKQHSIDKRHPVATEMSPSIISLGGLRLVFLYDYECVPSTAFAPHIHVIYCDVCSSLHYFQFLLFLMILRFSFYQSQ